MRICILAAGAGGMICGSCLRDNALALALRQLGHDATLVPLYTPIRTDVTPADRGSVYFGGVNVYLQHASRLFRHTPRFIDWLFDRQWLLKLAGRMGAETPPARLGPLTVSMLRGEQGPEIKELDRLIDHLQATIRPEAVTLPNLMFVGVARRLRERLNCSVVCELTGEDIFLEALTDPHRSEAQRLCRENIRDCSAVVATSRSYARKMAVYLDMPLEQIHVVHPGVPPEQIAEKASSASARPPTVGYLARLCPEKGFDQLVRAMELLIGKQGMKDARLKSAGYLPSAQRAWHGDLARRGAAFGEFQTEVDLAGKLKLLDSIDLFSVPTAYEEAKGIYILEAMARGVPVVQPAHGSFVELVELTGGGVLFTPGNVDELAETLARLLCDQPLRQKLAEQGRQAVLSRFTTQHMARNMLEVFQRSIA